MAGAGAGAEKRDKGGAGAENKLFRLPNTAKKDYPNIFLRQTSSVLIYLQTNW